MKNRILKPEKRSKTLKFMKMQDKMSKLAKQKPGAIIWNHKQPSADGPEGVLDGVGFH